MFADEFKSQETNFDLKRMCFSGDVTRNIQIIICYSETALSNFKPVSGIISSGYGLWMHLIIDISFCEQKPKLEIDPKDKR
jgi:hypothetical protein